MQYLQVVVSCNVAAAYSGPMYLSVGGRLCPVQNDITCFVIASSFAGKLVAVVANLTLVLFFI